MSHDFDIEQILKDNEEKLKKYPIPVLSPKAKLILKEFEIDWKK